MIVADDDRRRRAHRPERGCPGAGRSAWASPSSRRGRRRTAGLQELREADPAPVRRPRPRPAETGRCPRRPRQEVAELSRMLQAQHGTPAAQSVTEAVGLLMQEQSAARRAGPMVPPILQHVRQDKAKFAAAGLDFPAAVVEGALRLGQARLRTASAQAAGPPASHSDGQTGPRPHAPGLGLCDLFRRDGASSSRRSSPGRTSR